MTLVVTDVSKHGIVLIGDSAARNEKTDEIYTGAIKTYHIPNPNVGITAWGTSIGGVGLDRWIEDFIENKAETAQGIEEVAKLLRKEVQNDLAKTSPTNGSRRGFHVSGYKDGEPKLWHIHHGHPWEETRELRIHRDYPERKPGLQDVWRSELEKGLAVSLCNGLYRYYQGFYDAHVEDIERETASPDSWKDQLRFHGEIFAQVCDLAQGPNHTMAVAKPLSWIAFNEEGLIDERIP